MATLGSGVDGSVMKRTIGYDGQGNASVFTSYDSSNAIVNQVVRAFNGFGQVTRENQAAAGAVNTPQFGIPTDSEQTHARWHPDHWL